MSNKKGFFIFDWIVAIIAIFSICVIIIFIIDTENYTRNRISFCEDKGLVYIPSDGKIIADDGYIVCSQKICNDGICELKPIAVKK